MMRTTRSDLDRVQRIAVERGTRSWSGCLWRACKGVQALAPPGSWKKIWEKVLSLSICLSTHLSHTTETSTLLRIKCERYIFIKKCVRSFIEIRKLSLIMFQLVFGYTTVVILWYVSTNVNNLVVKNFLWPLDIIKEFGWIMNLEKYHGH